MAAASLALTASAVFAAPAPMLLLFGGEGHKTFLGCINCGKSDPGAICNKLGDHGSTYADQSIWNMYGNFGGRYSDYSPWNPYAGSPPAIVDKQGTFYGYLAANKYLPDRTRMTTLVELTNLWEMASKEPGKLAEAFCEGM
jgi:hypothetical protein